jgi:ParB-like chromosome segregation protein Spo0J
MTNRKQKQEKDVKDNESFKDLNSILEYYKGKDIVKIGDVEFKLPYKGKFPPLPQKKFDQLYQSIAKGKITVPLDIDENFNVIDGEHRLIIGAHLGLKDLPFKIHPGLSEDEKRQLAYDLNVLRRQMTDEQIQELAVKLRQEGKSYRQISEKLGVSHTKARTEVNKATVNEITVELPATIKGKDGKVRSAKMERKRNPQISVNTVKDLKKATDACTIAGVENLPSKIIDKKGVERIARNVQAQKRREQNYKDVKVGQVELLLGDFRIRGAEIESASVDMIFTDPEYSKEALSLWNELGKLASRVLKPSGILAAYSGNLYIPQIHQMLSQHLDYLWTGAIYHSGGRRMVHKVKINQVWKPVPIYYKPPLKIHWSPFADMVSGGQSKDHHEWEQAASEAAHFIDAMCKKKSTLLDPMFGSGSSILAGLSLKHLGLTIKGIEIDKAAFGTAQERIENALKDLGDNGNNLTISK